MVYGGRPSFGCQSCKLRRIKCDETFPSCTRCERAGRQCPGVPRPFDLIFRNETSTVTKRAKLEREKKKTLSERASPDTDSSVELISHSNSDHDCIPLEVRQYLSQISPALRNSMEDVAISYFVKKSVQYPKRPYYLSPYLHNLAEILPTALSTSTIHRTTAAVALCSLANFPEFRHLKAEASTIYGHALSLLGADLNDHARSKSDETLLGVLLMVIYESMVPSQYAASNLQNHMRGAMALLRHRGPSQFQNRRSLQLFRSIRNQIISHCIRTASYLSILETDPFWLADADHYQNPVNDLYLITAKIPFLRARTNDLKQLPQSTENMSQFHEILSEAQSLDARLQKWFQDLPDTFRYTSKYILATVHGDEIENASAWPGLVHIYKDLFVAYMANSYREKRIYLQGVIAECTTWINPKQDDMLYRQAIVTTKEMVDDLCASVPYHLQYVRELTMNCQAPKSNEQVAAGANGAFFLLWPFFAALQAEGIPDLQRRWLRGRLQFFSDTYRFHQAKVLSNNHDPRTFLVTSTVLSNLALEGADGT